MAKPIIMPRGILPGGDEADFGRRHRGDPLLGEELRQAVP